MKYAIALMVAMFGHPKPHAEVTVFADGSKRVCLRCPDGYVGNATWHTYSGMTKEQQLAQYLKDAKRGVCTKATPGGA